MARRLSIAPVAWGGDDVRIADVSAHLAEFATAAAADPEVALASALNLVVMAADAGELAELERLIDELDEGHPSRVVLVARADDEGARIAADCRMAPGSGRRVCVERIGLTLSGPAAAEASAVLPLLRGALPTYLWWPREPEPADPGWRALARICCRVICEADRSALAPERALDLLRDAAAAQGAPAVTDLAWARLTPWRQLVGQMVDGERWSRLRAGPSRVTVTGGGLEPLLMAGWLRWLCGPRLEVRTRPDGRHLQALELIGPRGGVLAVTRDDDRPAVAVEVRWPGAPARRRALPLRCVDRARLVAGELELRGRDRPFEAAVSMALEVTS